MNEIKKTLSIIKPDAVERNLSEEIKSIFKNNGFEIIKEKKNKNYQRGSRKILFSSSNKTILQWFM